MTADLFSTVILAGGLATRLRPVTATIPKSLIEINGDPFISHQLKLLHAQGIRKAVICIGFLGEMIQDFVGDGKRFGMEISYSQDGETLLGTAGAVKKALPYLSDDFFIVYGDSYLTCDYAAVQSAYIQNRKLGLMTVYQNNNQFDKSNVVFSQNKIITYNKSQQTVDMRHIDYGLSIFNKRAFDSVPEKTPCDLVAVYQRLLSENQLSGFEVKQRFYETGSFSGIKELENYLKEAQQMEFIESFLKEAQDIISQLDKKNIQKIVEILAETKSNAGRLFILGVGGSAANASHAVNDFRKIVGIEAYAPTDNVSELTARTNDEGWETVFSKWLEVSRLNNNDTLLILSVGGGNLEKNVSPNLISAIQLAKKVGAKVTGIVSRDGGYTAKMADAALIIPTPNANNTTPHAEAFQAVIWHLIVSHPLLKTCQTKWESVANG